MKNNKPNAELVWKQLEDDLVPRLGLNLGERVVYAHLLRHSRLAGKTQLRFSIRRLAHDTHVSHTSARQAVRRLIAKGALRLVDRTQAGHRIEVLLPEEILDAPRKIPVAACFPRRPRSASFEEMNFLQGQARRDAIHARDCGRCFYCLGQLSPRERCLDHVVPQARGGTNTYRNLVSCCVECNAQKGQTAADDFLRSLCRQRRITSAELEARLNALEALAAGKLRPILAPPAAVVRERRRRDTL
jgi:predicted DNA-binding transcriptional regulator